MDSTPSTARKKRSALLDCIRAVAVSMVILFHVGVELGTVPDPVAAWFTRHGLLGVDIFFPLSGFLITSFLIRHHDGPDIGIFFLRRFFRIVPLYMVALIVFALASLATATNLDTIGNLWKNALFLTGWTIFHEGRSVVPYTITWSLSVEEFAYIVIGLGAFVLRGRIAALLLALTLGALALRFAINVAGLPNVYFYPPARLDSVALGGLTAWAMMRGKPVLLPLLGALGIGWIGLQMGRIPFHTLIYFEISILTCMTIYIIAKYLPNARGPVIDAIASAGYYSDFIYLFHYFNIAGIIEIESAFGIDLGFWFVGFLSLLLSYGQAWLSFRVFEGPLMAFGRRLEVYVKSERLPRTRREISK